MHLPKALHGAFQGRTPCLSKLQQGSVTRAANNNHTYNHADHLTESVMRSRNHPEHCLSWEVREGFPKEQKLEKKK